MNVKHNYFKMNRNRIFLMVVILSFVIHSSYGEIKITSSKKSSTSATEEKEPDESTKNDDVNTDGIIKEEEDEFDSSKFGPSTGSR